MRDSPGGSLARRSTALAAVLLLVVAPVAGVTAVASHGTETPDGAAVTPGDRLQAAVGVQEAEVEGDLRERAFGVAFTAAETNGSKAAVVGEVVEDLETRLDRLERRKGELQAARENGTIGESEYRAEIAVLAARIETVRRLANQSAAASRRLPAAALRNRGVDPDAIRRLGNRAANLTGPEVAAIARSVAGPRAGKQVAAGNRPNVTGPPQGVPGRNGTGPPGKNGSGGSGAGGGGGNDGGQGNADSDRSLVPQGESVGAGIVPIGAASGVPVRTVGVSRPYAVGFESVSRLRVPWNSASGIPASNEPEGEPLFSVDLQAEGPARVTLGLTFDLTTESDRSAFKTLQDDSQARADVRDRFESRLQDIANTSERRVDREMRVDDAAISLSTLDNGSTGLVTLSVAWTGLAGRTDDAEPHLVITEPFASGFTPSRQFTVRILAPDEYRLTSVSPDPDAQTNDSATWQAGTDLTDFTLVFAPGTETPLPDDVVEEFQPTSPTVTTATGGNGSSGTSLLVGAAIAIAVAIGGGLLWRRRKEVEAAEGETE